ncbi:MAG TPA: ABC transporter permease [Lacunisphaera sp.]|nr:ABC transporter permease [Lacunisphaera sp.]
MLSDLRLAFRSLSKSPGFATIVILTLALGIGANTAIFSFFNGILLRPLPYADAERLVMVKRGPRNFGDIMGAGVGLQSADYLDLKAQARSLSSLTTYTSDVATLSGRGAPDLIYGAIVPANFFTVVGSDAALGQVFRESPGGAPVGGLAVISHTFWQTKFAGDPAIVGQTITLNGSAFVVQGIMAPDFNLPRSVQFWVTADGPTPAGGIGAPVANVGGRGNFLRTVIGRLAPGVTQEQAEKEIAAQVLRLPNPTQADRVVHLVNLRDQSVGDVRRALAVLLAGVVLVLLIACLNIGNLMLSRATTRQRELSIRLALGASRWQIARQLLAESLLLSLIGGVGGCLLSWWTVEFLVKIAPEDIPRLAAVQVDGGVLAFACLISVFTGLVCGLAPIVSTASTDLNTAMKAGGDRGGSGHALPRRLRSILVGGEVAISLVLLISAGLLLRSFQEMIATSWGFEPRNVAVLRVAFTDQKYRAPGARLTYVRRLLDELSRKPSFESVAVSFDKIGESWLHLPFFPEGVVFAKPEDAPVANYHSISPDYFRTLGITVHQGRAFAETDSGDSPRVAIIDATTARHYFSDTTAVGKRMRLAIRGDHMAEIVGVVGDVKTDGPEAAPQPAIYVPYYQGPSGYVYVYVRTPLEASAAGKTIQQVVQGIDAGSATTEMGSMEQVIERPAANRRFPLVLIGVFSSLALVLAGVGIYGVTAYGVAQRTRELGVRLALGARPLGLVALVLRQGFLPIGIGLGVGIAGGLVVASALLRGMLYKIHPVDPLTFVAVSLLLATIALIACWLPARRATKVDPLIALRAD